MVVASLLELTNALTLTYLASEYILKDQLNFERQESGIVTRRSVYVVAAWLLVNVTYFVVRLVSQWGLLGLHLPAWVLYILVPTLFFSLAWWDVRRIKPETTFPSFFRQTTLSTLESLIILPLVSIAVAIAFLLLVAVCDVLHVPTTWLNSPIYYGVLYGPFSAIYFLTKRRCVKKKAAILPM
mmetsp:Transcript_8554/g.22066  ORF Transcript_8554/g.22066 Transcript_8554/m.22066 type:complete len:183 (-) Transcript_8554:210-758(-)